MFRLLILLCLVFGFAYTASPDMQEWVQPRSPLIAQVEQGDGFREELREVPSDIPVGQDTAAYEQHLATPLHEF